MKQRKQQRLKHTGKATTVTKEDIPSESRMRDYNREKDNFNRNDDKNVLTIEKLRELKLI